MIEGPLIIIHNSAVKVGKKKTNLSRGWACLQGKLIFNLRCDVHLMLQGVALKMHSIFKLVFNQNDTWKLAWIKFRTFSWCVQVCGKQNFILSSAGHVCVQAVSGSQLWNSCDSGEYIVSTGKANHWWHHQISVAHLQKTDHKKLKFYFWNFSLC